MLPKGKALPKTSNFFRIGSLQHHNRERPRARGNPLKLYVFCLFSRLWNQGARFFLHLFTVLFCPLRAKAFFDMLPLDHPPPGLCWFVLCTSCGFCFDLPRDHPMFGVHLLSFAPLWVFGFLLNFFWARHCGFLHRVLFAPLLGPVLTFHATTPCLAFITVCTRFLLDLFWALL